MTCAVTSHDNIDLYPGPSKAELQLSLLQEDRGSPVEKGSIALLAEGLKIEETQWAWPKTVERAA